MIGDGLTAELLTATVTSLWVGSLLAVGVGLVIRCLPMSPSIRYRLWALVLGLTVMAPLIRPSGRRITRPGDLPAVVAPPSAALPPGAQAVPLELPTHQEESHSSTVSVPPLPTIPARSVSLDPFAAEALLLIWIGGALAGLAWLAFQAFRLMELKRATSLPETSLLRLWESLPMTRRRPRVRLLLSQRSRVPAACGYFHPAVVAPAALCRQLNEEQTRHLLLHELAHLARFDDWGQLAHRVVQAIFWWHPVVWFVGQRLDTERELACDEIVVAGAGRRAYARTLVRVAEIVTDSHLALALGALRGNLTHRVESLLGRPAKPIRKTARSRAGLAAVSVVGLAIWVAPPEIRLGHDADPAEVAQLVNDGPGIARHLDSVFAAYADSGFSGSVLLALGDEVVLSRGYGLADRERGIPATAETRYSVAGFTKMFTAAAVLTLEAEGRLHVTDSLKSFFTLSGTDAEVTLHQLLTHTDGLTRQNAPVYRRNPDDFIRVVSATPDSFAPGQGYRYNDFGHSVLGVIIERVSGRPYESYIRERFLRPAGLAATRFEDEEGAFFATEYAGPSGRQYPIPRRSYTWGRRGSLGLVSTVGDMFRWVQALNNPRVIPALVRDRMFQSHGPTSWGAERGYGWDLMRQPDGGTLWRRVAGTPGMEGEILYDPAGGWTAVILVNTRVEWRFRVWNEITAAIKRSHAVQG